VELSGFPAAYLSGSAVAMSLLGLPDLGLVSSSEMLEQARRTAAATTVPLICDADTGYGSALNVARTVRDLEGARVAGVQLEDQEFPKRCGHFEDKRVIPRAEMVMKIKAALDARRDPRFVIIARTDARAVLGLDEAIERGLAYAEAGADIIFVEAPQSKAELLEIGRRCAAPLMVNVVEGGKTPQLPLQEYADAGFKIVLYPTTGVRVAGRALSAFYKHLHDAGTSVGLAGGFLDFDERNAVNALVDYQRLEDLYAVRTDPPVVKGH
jgi:methylisocitrate lyase